MGAVISSDLLDTKKIWKGSKSEFGKFVLEIYEEDSTSQIKNRKYRNKSDAMRKIFPEYKFSDYTDWTVEKALYIMRK